MLFAQSALTDINAKYLLPALVVAAVLIFALIVLVLALRFCRFNRQLLHTERLRAIEAGQPMEPPDPSKARATYMHNAFWISFWLVFAVPGATFSAAASATEKLSGNLGLGLVIWLSAGGAVIAAVVCAAVVMVSSRARPYENTSLVMEKKPPKTMERSF